MNHSSGIRGHLVALGGFVALTCAFFWPVLRHFPSRILSEGGDGSTFLWSYWYMPRAVQDLDNPFVTTHLFHPVGANLTFHTTTPLEAALSWPIARLVGLGVAVNVLQLIAVILSAVGAYLLALHVCGDRRAAFFAGAAFAFVPYRFVHLGGHFNLIHAQFLPLPGSSLRCRSWQPGISWLVAQGRRDHGRGGRAGRLLLAARPRGPGGRMPRSLLPTTPPDGIPGAEALLGGHASNLTAGRRINGSQSPISWSRCPTGL